MSKDTKQFDSETMAVVLYAMLESGVVLGTKHYAMMAAIDPHGRTASSFDHQFRKVKARAKELQEQAKSGGFGTPAKSVKAGPTQKKSGTKTSAKRGRKAAEEMENEDDEEETPSKKFKAEGGTDEDGYQV